MCIYITLKGIDGQSRTKHVYYFNVCNRIFAFSKQSVRKIYLPRNKTTKDVKNFKIGGYVYAEKKYICVKLIVISK